MKKEEKALVLLGIGFAAAIVAVALWFITLPAIGIYFYLKYRKKKGKENEKNELQKLRKKVKRVERRYTRAKANPNRICRYCSGVIERVSAEFCPYCGSVT